MQERLERARHYLDRRTAIVILATSDGIDAVDAALLVGARLLPDGTLAGGEEDLVGGRTFRNLRRHAKAAVVVLDPISDPRARDGVRMDVEFLGAEEDGEELRHLTEWLSSFAPGRRIVRRLLFKVIAVHDYRPATDAVLQR